MKQQLVTEYSKDLISIKKGTKIDFTYDYLNQSSLRFNSRNQNLKLVFSNDLNDSLVIDYNSKQKIFSIDRKHSGYVDFEKTFGKDIHKTSLTNLVSESVDYQIILDWSSIEIFINGGVYSFTEQLFPKKPYTKLSIQSDENQEITNLTINKIKGIWQK